MGRRHAHDVKEQGDSKNGTAATHQAKHKADCDAAHHRENLWGKQLLDHIIPARWGSQPGPSP